jgi:prephenate dehydrogenase
MSSPAFKKITIFGVGLIGGSFALALKAAHAVAEIVGVGRDPAHLRRAIELGVITRAEDDPGRAVSGADLVMLAVPVGQMENIMRAIAPHLTGETVVTDAGSTKQDVVRLARQFLAARLGQFVPAHPIAGAEKSGVDAAKAELYRDRNLVLTPLDKTAPQAVAVVEQAWKLCGAKIRRMSPAAHDQIFAAVSHLPHVLAFALVEELAGRGNAEEFFRYAAGGFRDFTRIASSSPEMWRDICLANRAAIDTELEQYQAQLQNLRRMLRDGDGAALEALFERARTARNQWLADSGLE